MDMSKYNKLWGSLIGGIIGLLIAYGLVPQNTGDSITQLANLAIPLVTSAIATYFAPKNSNTK